MMNELLLAGVVLGGGFAAVELVRRMALRRGMLDVPGARSSHQVPTPRGGGLVIVVTSLAAPLAADAWSGTPLERPVLAWIAGGAAIALLGWRDDVRSLSTVSRLTVQIAAAGLVLACAGWPALLELPVLGRVGLGWTGPLLALLWIVGLTNAYNFMDGIDGIAAGQAVVAGAAWGIIGGLADAPQVTAIGWAVAVSSAAFMLHNWSPARIFMGDVGSGFLGFTFAVLPLMLVAGASRIDPARLPWSAAALVWPFLFDAFATFLRRLLRGENVFEAHRRHLYQRLVVAGASHRGVATLYSSFALAAAILTVAWLNDRQGAGPLLLGVLLTFSGGLVLRVRARERGC
jgi:UDP-N-acetylmuramyl pentapeptide phosphotransferase/UDP-N-acetylglucosamine-1-phosphate transferase